METGNTSQGSPAGRLVDWLGLRLIPGVGSVIFARLVESFGEPGRALGAPLKRLQAVRGVSPDLARVIRAKQFSSDPEKELARLEKMGARVITRQDPDYPPLLATIYAPPPLLFVRGSLAPGREQTVAVVGSRRTTPYGRRMAQELGRDLARAGVSLVSGLARGIDSIAHQAALQAGGHTVGVVGCGLDVVYPPENAGLMKRMAEQGAVVSEFPLGTKPLAANFPIRNRVISGLSRAVVVVEAGLRSGSLITARHALDQGREVFAVPGPVGNPGSAGCHQLIRQGACLLESAQDILEPGALPLFSPPATPAPEPAGLPPQGQKLLELIGDDPVHLDVLARQSGFKAQEVTALLVNLEMAGLVQQLPGKYFVRDNQVTA